MSDDPDHHLIERRVGGTTLISGGFLEVRRDDVLLPDGSRATREFIRHDGAVAVVPILDDGRLVLVRQYRYPVAKVLLEWPAGKRDPGESNLACAMRELQEETGMTSVTLLDQTTDWLTYDLPEFMIGTGLKGKYRGQKQMWFAYRFEGDEKEIAINPPPHGHSPEFDDWRWEDMHNLPDLIVDFKVDIYRQVVARFSHLSG